jgi:basic amino acid/polyamine antiporter, APA family
VTGDDRGRSGPASSVPGNADASAAPDRALLRAVGTWALAASIVNITIGGGIFRLPAVVAGSLGSAAPLAYLACAAVMGLIVICFAEAGSRVSLTGGPYAYVEVAFGAFVGFLAGVLLWLLSTLAVAAVSTIFADAIGALVPALGGPAARAGLLVAGFVALGWVNVRGVRQGTRLNAIATVAKLLPLLLLVIAGAFAVRAENFTLAQPRAGDVARTSILLIFAFAGLEGALVPSGEVKDPPRTVPRALFLAMVGITLLYLALQIVSQGILGPGVASATAPLADAAGVALGPWGRTLLLVGAAVSMFGNVSGMTLAIPRALFAFGRDGFLPRQLAAVHPRFRTPHVAIVVQSVIVCALAVTGTFERLAILANVALLILYAACCAAAWELRRRDVRAGGVRLRVPGGGIAPVPACLGIAWLLTSIRPAEWAVVGGTLAVASAIFALTRSRRRLLAATEQ